jgi:hypothetical protein
MLACTHALTALDADIGLCAALLTCHDLNAGIVGMELLIKGFGASLHTLQTSHTLYILFNSQLLHNKGFSFM